MRRREEWRRRRQINNSDPLLSKLGIQTKLKGKLFSMAQDKKGNKREKGYTQGYYGTPLDKGQESPLNTLTQVR